MFSSGVQKIKLSKDFHDTCVRIGECKSREEEEQIVSKWMTDVKKVLSKSKIGLSDLYENVISLIHLTLLGYNTSFGQIHAVNLTQDSQMMTKCLGYLACSALFDSKSDLIVLIVNSTQRDLSSQHPTSMALALTAIAHLVTPELIQPVIGFIGNCLNHAVPMIRQKAVMCIHSFISKDPSCVVEFFPDLCRLLSDPDLSIVNAVVCTFTTLLKHTLNIRQICDVLPEIVRSAQVILSGNCRVEYVHQRISAPFILVNIYKLFQKMAEHCENINETVEPLLTQSLQVGTLESPASASVLYEAIRTCITLGLTEIPQLRGAISLFMGSREQNYLLIGLSVLSSIPDFASEFQGVVIDCLEHPDPSIRLKTLSLLHAMASEENSQIIVINMLRFFQRTKNENIRRDLADRITDIASKYSPSPIWFAKTMEQLFAIGGDLVRPEVGFAVIRLIDEDCDEEMRRSIVNLYLDVAQSGRKLSDVFVMVIAHVIGNYAELSDEYELSFIILMLCDLSDAYDGPREWVLNAIVKLLPKLEETPQEVINVFENYKSSRNIIVQEICFEALALLNFRESLTAVLEAEPEEDNQLSFLDDFVNDAVQNKGMKEYIPLDDRDDDLIITNKPTLIFTAYPQGTVANVYSADGVAQGGQAAAPEPEDNGLNTAGINVVWGEQGIVEGTEAEELHPQTEVYGAGSYQEPEPEQPVKKPSMFAKLSMASKKNTNSAEEKKAELAGKLFKGVSKAKKSIKAPVKAAPVQQAAPVAPPVQQIQLSAEDAAALDKAAEECQQPQPEEIAAFSQTGTPVPVFADEQMKVACLAREGKILLAVMNSSEVPMLNFSLTVHGPDALNKDVKSHPQQLVCIPPGNAILQLNTFTFPKQMRGFPQFIFKAEVQYNGKKVEFQLPASLLTFVLPGEATTAEFGKLWKSGGSEIVYTMPRMEGVTIDQICQALNTVVGLKTVQRIKMEEIFIGTLWSTPFKILFHLKFGAQKVDIKVLTKAQPLTAALVNELKKVFA